MKKTLKYITIAGIIPMIIFAVFALKSQVYGNSDGTDTPEIDYASDVIGTRVGTSTTPVYFLKSAASSTYRVYSGGAEEIIFTVLPSIASSTGARADFAFYGSNNWNCDTASSTAGLLNNIITTDINWYDIGTNVAEVAGSQALTGTTTISMLAYQGLGKTITISHLNYQCIKIEAHGSSTSLLMQARLK